MQPGAELEEDGAARERSRVPLGGASLERVNAMTAMREVWPEPASEPRALDAGGPRQAEEELRRSEYLYRTVASNIPNGAVALFDRDLRYMVVDGGGVLAAAGVDKEGLVGKSIPELLPAETWKSFAPLCHSALAGRPAKTEVQALGRTFSIHILPIPAGDGAVSMGMVMALDITELKSAEERVRRVNESLERRVVERTAQLEGAYRHLQALSAHLHSVREKEQARIAREIHDELGQALTGLKFELSSLAQRLRGRPGGLAKRAADLTALVDQTIQDVRRISSELRPALLDDLGLVAALEWHTREFAKRVRIQCKFEALGQPPDVDPDLRIALFRICQEALTNVVRHARAAAVRVVLDARGDRIVLEVRDDGIGISPAHAGGGSLGLLGMRERARAFGGKLEIESVSGGGTLVRAEIPLRK